MHYMTESEDGMESPDSSRYGVEKCEHVEDAESAGDDLLELVRAVCLPDDRDTKRLGSCRSWCVVKPLTEAPRKILDNGSSQTLSAALAPQGKHPRVFLSVCHPPTSVDEQGGELRNHKSRALPSASDVTVKMSHCCVTTR